MKDTDVQYHKAYDILKKELEMKKLTAQYEKTEGTNAHRWQAAEKYRSPTGL